MTANDDDRIVLIGMMGSGKSTVGRLLAERMGRTYVDNDAAVRALTDRDPAAIWSVSGEAALHAAEATALLRALEETGPCVISAAAWVVEDPACVAALRAVGQVVYLRARPATLRTRIGHGAGRRQDATDLAWLGVKAEYRDARYRELATLTLDVDDLSPADVVDVIVKTLSDRA